MIRSRIVIIPILDRLRVQTVGTEAVGSPMIIDLDVPLLRNLLVHAEEITLLALTETPTTFFAWNIGLYSGYNRSNDSGSGMPVKLGQDPISGGNPAGSKRHTAYSNLANLMLESRPALLVWNSTTGTAQLAQLSASLLVKTVGA